MSIINTELFYPRNAVPILIMVVASSWFLRRFITPILDPSED